jgi:hypothetical protein
MQDVLCENCYHVALKGCMYESGVVGFFLSTDTVAGDRICQHFLLTFSVIPILQTLRNKLCFGHPVGHNT